MEYGFSPYAAQFAHFDGGFDLRLSPVHSPSPWDIARLRNEKEILEDGLANCVTCLHVLRKKYARNERLLNADPSPPRKKRKKIQQNNHELEKELTNLKRDEEAFLSNLQNCKVNLYIAEGVPYSPTPLYLPTTDYLVTDYPSSTTQCSSYDESEYTEMSWNGWTNEAMSPFAREARNPFFPREIVPDEIVDEEEHEANGYRTTELSRLHIYDGETCASFQVPPNTARTPQQHSTLSPVATTFKPRPLHALDDTERLVEGVKKLLVSSTIIKKRMEAVRRVTDVGFQRVSVQTRPTTIRTQIQTWSNTTPQKSPREKSEGHRLKRSWTNSF